MIFDDRSDAGRRLSARLLYLHGADIVVLGLPRGGVPVAFEVARALGAPLDVLVVRKLGVPHQPELAFGAIGEDGVRVVNDSVIARARIAADDMAAVERSERAELSRRVQLYRGPRSRVSLTGRTAIIVDDGVATGATARAACQVARAQGAAHIVLAVPVVARDTLDILVHDADELVYVEAPTRFLAVGMWYRRFGQTSDREVAELLRRAAKGVRSPSASAAADPPLRDEEVQFVVGTATLNGHLAIPEHPIGLVVFAHGSGSGRHSPRNRYVANVLENAGLGTLLFDLLTPDEEAVRTNVFDIELLARRLVEVTRAITDQEHVSGLPIGYFGASTGAAAALQAAADRRLDIRAVVSRGGRPDLAGAALPRVQAPTLLIVGGNDRLVLDLNRRARAEMTCETMLEVVPGATHLFSEEGTLEQVAELARDWFTSRFAHATAGGGHRV